MTRQLRLNPSLPSSCRSAYAAPPLNEIISPAEGEHPPVWPDPEGSARGYELEPLYPSVPKAARLDNGLYELLALVDAIRDGRARERNLAVEHLQKRLKKKNAAAWLTQD
jgi:hypothetical protein